MNRPQSDTHEAEIARLTERERECLRHWLEHKTAKEIALDIGISHHAVEKRLKMARTKLGVATSLDAARILAQSEGYGRTVAGPAEVGYDKPSSSHVDLITPSHRTLIDRRALMFASAILILAGIAGFGALDNRAATQLSDETGTELGTGISDGRHTYRIEVDPEPGVDPVSITFLVIDDDRSGSLTFEEFHSGAQIFDLDGYRSPSGFVKGTRILFDGMDRNADSLITPNEFENTTIVDADGTEHQFEILDLSQR